MKKEKIIEDGRKIFSKLIFVIEFVLSLVLMIFFYKLITTKAYEGYYSKKYLVMCFVLGVLIGGIIIYNFIKNRKKIEKIFLTIAIPIGLMYLVFLVPTYAPDETAHIYRSYETSKGQLFTKVDENNEIKSTIPTFFVNNTHNNLKKYYVLNEKINEETDYNTVQDVSNPAHSYFPTLYFPNTIIFAIARIFSMNGLLAIYIARLVNFIIFLVGGYFAIKIIPFGKILMMTYMLIPMTIHQAISLSADSITNTTVFLFIAYTLYLYYKDTITKNNKIGYIILTVLIALQKLVYFPIILISLIFINTKKMNKKEKLRFIGIALLIGILLGGVWIILSSKGTNGDDLYAIQNNVNSVEQVKYVLKNPIAYIKVLINTINVNIENYYVWFMGYSMGWMDICVQRPILDMYFVLLLFSPFLEKNDKELDFKSKIILCMIFLIISLLIFTAFYVGYSGVGTDIIKGIQGRYFIPIVLLVFISVIGKERYIKIKYVEFIYPILISLLNISAVNCIIKFFI